MRRSGEEQKESAASDVIAFVMILFIIVVVIAGWMLYVVPSQGNEAETSHNEKVLLEFVGLKEGIDSLWMNDLKGYENSYIISMSPSERTSLSTLLYLAPTLGSGLLKVENGTTMNITDTEGIRNYDAVGALYKLGYKEGNSTNVTLLRISYYTDNKYAQNYIITYEGGVVWYSSDSGQTYELLTPFIDHRELKDTLLLIARPPGSQDYKLLGNGAVSVNYHYERPFYADGYNRNGSLIGYDYRLKGKTLVNPIPVTREYIELEKAVTDIYPASESTQDKKIANYWKSQLADLKTRVIYGDGNGAKIMINYFDVSLRSGGF